MPAAESLVALLASELRAEPSGEQLSLAVARHLQRQNQFVDLSPERLAELRELCEQAVAHLFDVMEGDSQEAVSEAVHLLSQEIQDWFARREPGANVPSTRQQVVCSEYSATLQLAVLGLGAETLREPVLDLGCGEHAELVVALRQRGIEAFGIDRVARPAPFVLLGDWFSRRLDPETWGTVISHMAFSNHFVHQDRRGGPEAALYAQKYMEILRSLLPGGTFAYAPDLPFIEEHLPEDEYAVERVSVRSEDGELLPYAATRVTRGE